MPHDATQKRARPSVRDGLVAGVTVGVAAPVLAEWLAVVPAIFLAAVGYALAVLGIEALRHRR